MNPSSIWHTTAARIPTEFGEFQLYHYRNSADEKEHLAITCGDVRGSDLLVRVHSECFTGDVLGSRRCDCGEQLERALQVIAAAGRGAVIYLRQEGRGIGLESKLRAYNLQDEGYDTVDANLMLGHQADEREYWAAAGILADLEVDSIRLITNNPAKIEKLTRLGVLVTERLPLMPTVHADNAGYLATKAARMRHLLTPEFEGSTPQESPIQVPDAAVTTVQPETIAVHHDLPATQSTPVTVISSAPTADTGAMLARLHAAANGHLVQTGRPFVTLSYAQSLDGSIAAEPGRPTRLSGRAAMQLTHCLRALHDAILVGIGTVLADDPSLTVRLIPGPQPQPVVLDSRLRTPAQARVLAHPRGAIIAADRTVDRSGATGYDNRATILQLPGDRAGHLNLEALLGQLGTLGIASVMVEGGAGVITSFLAAGLVDYIALTIAPRYLAGFAALNPEELPSAAAFPRLSDIRVSQLGDDVVLWGRPDWSAPQAG